MDVKVVNLIRLAAFMLLIAGMVIVIDSVQIVIIIAVG